MVKLYAWATPAFYSNALVDHTWITDFDNRKHSYPAIEDVRNARENYWFCWGGYHSSGGVPKNPTGALGQKSGNVSMAKCLVMANADSRQQPQARGAIFVYGVDGVCHQLANQVLYATGANPLTVKGARGYQASVFLYGTYGLQKAAWATKIQSCSSRRVVTRQAVEFSGGVLKMADLPDEFDEHAKNVLSDDPETLRRLLGLKNEVQRFTAIESPGVTPPPASALNSRNQHLIDQAARLLDQKQFVSIFGFDPEERISLVDPEMVGDRLKL